MTKEQELNDLLGRMFSGGLTRQEQKDLFEKVEMGEFSRLEDYGIETDYRTVKTSVFIAFFTYGIKVLKILSDSPKDEGKGRIITAKDFDGNVVTIEFDNSVWMEFLNRRYPVK